MSDITFEVKRTVAVLSSSAKGWKKEVNLISWNNGPVKLDIREWSPDKSSMKKGITLSRGEAQDLKRYLDILDFALLGDTRRQITQSEREEFFPSRTDGSGQTLETSAAIHSEKVEQGLPVLPECAESGKKEKEEAI